MGMSKRDYQVKLSKIRKANVQKQYKQSLRAEKQKYNTKHIETSKLLAIYLFVLFNLQTQRQEQTAVVWGQDQDSQLHAEVW